MYLYEVTKATELQWQSFLNTYKSDYYAVHLPHNHELAERLTSQNASPLSSSA